MKPKIENLKACMSGKSTTGYQRALAMREFEQLLTYVAELEQLRKNAVSMRSELLSAFSWVSSIGEQFFDSSKTVDDMVDIYQKSR